MHSGIYWGQYIGVSESGWHNGIYRGHLEPLLTKIKYKYASLTLCLSLRFMLQGLLHLISFFIGGFIIGLISPGIRIYEPAVGAFLSVSFMLALSLFTPYSFIQFSVTKMLIGGLIAFVLALVGARLGEKLAGNRV